MVSVLEKKMSMNSGLPPSLLNHEKFWELLTSHLMDWMFETFKVECDVAISTQKKIDAKEASEIMGAPTSYLVNDFGSAVPAGILLDETLMTKYAALRLSELPDQLSGTSPVFLQLLSETVVKDLLFRMSDWLTNGTETEKPFGASMIELSTAALSNTNTYMLVVIELATEDGEKFSINFIVETEKLLTLHAERTQSTRNGEAGAGDSNPTLRRSVRNSMLDLEVIIDQMSLTIADCSRLEIGQELPLPAGDRTKLSLVAKTIKGDENIAAGELGVWKNFKALKLNTPVSDGFIRNMVEL